MSDQIINLNLFFDLPDKQQELLSGGAEPQINQNNFAQRTGNTSSTNQATPLGNLTKTNTNLADVNSGAQSVLSSDALNVAPMGGLNNFNNFAPTSPYLSTFV